MQLGTTNARIHGTVTELAGTGAGVSVTVTDASGAIRIWCPAAVTALGPTSGGTFEFHITAPAEGAPTPPDWSALAGDPRLAALPVDMEAVAARLARATAPADAIATEIRAAEAW